jgi:hypothetical protein
MPPKLLHGICVPNICQRDSKVSFFIISTKPVDYIKTSPELKDGRLRIQTIREIHSTETRYVRDLDVCVKHFLEPLRNMPKKILKNEDIDSIFGTGKCSTLNYLQCSGTSQTNE